MVHQLARLHRPRLGRGVVASIAAAIGGIVAVAASSHAQVQFVENGQQRGILPYEMALGMGGGVSAADFDNDGDIDLFVPNAEGVPDQLYRNLGGGQFEEIALQAGVASLPSSRGGLWFDYDGDHRLDLFVGSDCFGALEADCPDEDNVWLYHQVDDGVFEDVTAEAGFANDLVTTYNQHRGGSCAVDLNNDGYLDLVTGLWDGEARVFQNNGDGTFTDVSLATGIGGSTEGHWQPIAHDFNHDGWMDLFWPIDFTENRLWLNQGDMTFVDVAAEAGVDNAWNDMGVTLGDYDNDGDLDIYVTEILFEERRNLLYRNDSRGARLTFAETAVQAGVEEAGWAWGATFFDCDHDGWLDLAVTNGFFNYDESKFFMNQRDDPVTFADVSAEVGFNDTYFASSLIAVDIDRDGDADLIQTCALGDPLRVLENQPSEGAADNHYLVIKPRMRGPNHRAIGATVSATVEGRTTLSLITAGTSLLGQEPAEAMFGLGAAESADSITVNWPDGTQTTVSNVAGDQVLTVWHGECISLGDLDGDSHIGSSDLLLLLGAWGTDPDGPPDLDGDGVVGTPDLLILLGNWGPCEG